MPHPSIGAKIYLQKTTNSVVKIIFRPVQNYLDQTKSFLLDPEQIYLDPIEEMGIKYSVDQYLF